MSKKLVVGVVVVLLLVTGLVWQLTANPDRIVVAVVEDVASDVLKTRVSVSDVSIDIEQGKASIGGLTIASSAGYFHEYIFEMKAIEVEFDLNSIQEGLLVIELLRIDQPRIRYETHGPGGSNMKVLLKNIKAAQDEYKSPDNDNELRVIIENLEINGGLIIASAVEAPLKTMKTELPAIKVSGIGRAQGGVSTEETASLVAGELVSSIIRYTAKLGVDRSFRKNNMNWLNAIRKDLESDG